MDGLREVLFCCEKDVPNIYCAMDVCLCVYVCICWGKVFFGGARGIRKAIAPLPPLIYLVFFAYSNFSITCGILSEYFLTDFL